MGETLVIRPLFRWRVLVPSLTFPVLPILTLIAIVLTGLSLGATYYLLFNQGEFELTDLVAIIFLTGFFALLFWSLVFVTCFVCWYHVFSYLKFYPDRVEYRIFTLKKLYFEGVDRIVLVLKGNRLTKLSVILPDEQVREIVVLNISRKQKMEVMNYLSDNGIPTEEKNDYSGY